MVVEIVKVRTYRRTEVYETIQYTDNIAELTTWLINHRIHFTMDHSPGAKTVVINPNSSNKKQVVHSNDMIVFGQKSNIVAVMPHKEFYAMFEEIDD